MANKKTFWIKVLKLANWISRKAIMKMTGKRDYYGEYMIIHKRLEEKEDVLRDAVYKYCTQPDGDVRMQDVDEIFKELKAEMREVRQLAKDAQIHVKKEVGDNE